MAAGLPGAGIGGLFYLLSALTLPVRRAWRRLRGIPDPRPFREVALQVSIAVGIVGGIAGAGWLLGVLHPGALLPRIVGGGSLAHAGETHPVLRVAAVVAGFATLALVLGAVEIARIVFGRRTVQDRAPTEL